MKGEQNRENEWKYVCTSAQGTEQTWWVRADTLFCWRWLILTKQHKWLFQRHLEKNTRITEPQFSRLQNSDMAYVLYIRVPRMQWDSCMKPGPDRSLYKGVSLSPYWPWVLVMIWCFSFFPRKTTFFNLWSIKIYYFPLTCQTVAKKENVFISGGKLANSFCFSCCRIQLQPGAGKGGVAGVWVHTRTLKNSQDSQGLILPQCWRKETIGPPWASSHLLFVSSSLLPCLIF